MKRKWFWSVLLLSGLCTAAFPAPPADFPEGIRLKPDGSFLFGDGEFIIQNYNAGWSPAGNSSWKNRSSRTDAGSWSLSATMPVDGNNGNVSESLRPSGPQTFELSALVKFDPPARINALHGAFYFPAVATTLTIDGKPFELPAEYREHHLLPDGRGSSITIPLAGGRKLTISAPRPFRFTIQDHRKYGTPSFSIRLPFTKSSGEIADSSLALQFRAESVAAQPVSLRTVANRGFADRPGARVRGWSAQGLENDLASFRPVPLTFEALKFEIIDPAANDGKSAVVIGGKERSDVPQEITVDLPAGAPAGAINLLHATAWSPQAGKPVGEIVVRYADGSEQTIPIRSRVDVNDWWNPVALANAWPLWQGENDSARIGLYASSYPLTGRAPRSATLRVTDNRALWMIPAITLTGEPVRFAVTEDKEWKLAAGKEWIPVEFRRDTVRGSALDFSFLQDAPAGKYGPIRVAPDGTLTFRDAPDKRIRLFGVPLCMEANYLSKQAVDHLAENFVANGYNSLRIHHFDGQLLDRNAADSLTFDPVKLDKLDYLFATMKKNGVYITTDFYTNRVFRPGDNIPECDFYDQRQMKILIPVSPAAMENWKEFARRWMNHVNPYTGIAWKDDPALYAVNLVNEEVLTSEWSRSPSAVKLYQERFEKWKREHHLPNAKMANNDKHFLKFLYELQAKCLDEQLRFFREELKMNALVTSLNYLTDLPLALLRDKFDLVDNHIYFNHPGFLEKQWSAPYKFHQDSAISRFAAAPRILMGSRIVGKPQILTEFSYCNPNRFRAEGGPLMGAYAALQDWDALHHFTWSHHYSSVENLRPTHTFDIANDPLAQLSDRITVAMFRRGDVKRAENAFAWNVTDATFDNEDPIDFPLRFLQLGLVSRIGSAVNGRAPAGTVLLDASSATDPARLADSKTAALWQRVINEKIAVSDTGEIRLDVRKNTFAVATPLTESVTLPEGELAAGSLAVRGATGFQTVAAISLDGRAVAESGSVLVIHLTNLLNTDIHFGNQAMTVVKDFGKLPALIQRNLATVEITTDRPFRVVALSADGDAKGEVPGTFAGGKFRFRADPACFPGGVMAYHLTRERR